MVDPQCQWWHWGPESATKLKNVLRQKWLVLVSGWVWDTTSCSKMSTLEEEYSMMISTALMGIPVLSPCG